MLTKIYECKRSKRKAAHQHSPLPKRTIRNAHPFVLVLTSPNKTHNVQHTLLHKALHKCVKLHMTEMHAFSEYLELIFSSHT